MKKVSKKYIALVLIGILMMVLASYFDNQISLFFKVFLSPEYIKNWLLSFGKLSIIVFILLQILQVVVFFIPGEIVQAAGGFVYGTMMGTILSFVGILIGSVITFYITRRYGLKVLKRIMKDESYKKLLNILNRPQNNLILFILYLIPGIPKDTLGFVAGVTKITLLEFIVLSMVGRIPGIFLMNYIGSSISSHSYIKSFLILGIATVLFIIGIWKKDGILDYFSKNKKEGLEKVL